MTTKITYLILLTLVLQPLVGCQIFFPDGRATRTKPGAAKATNIPKDPANSGELLKRAMKARQVGNLEQALAAFTKLLDQDPNNFDAHMGVGDIYHVKGDFGTAARTYERARIIQPQDFNVNYKLGLMYHLLNRLRDAVQIYLTALSLEPESYEANLNIATAYLQLNQPALGLPYAKKAVKINPKTMVGHANLGAIYGALAQYENSILSYRSASEWGELEPHVILGLVDAFVKTEKFTRAINTLKVINQQKPTTNTYERLGYIYFKTGDYDNSLIAYEKSSELDPNNAPALNGMGVNLMTKYLQGERKNKSLKKRAIAAWQRSVKLAPDQKRIIDLLSRYREL